MELEERLEIETVQLFFMAQFKIHFIVNFLVHQLVFVTTYESSIFNEFAIFHTTGFSL